MTMSTKAHHTSTQSKTKKAKVDRKKPQAVDQWLVTYQKYFTAPLATPESFRILDLTEGAGVSYSSHT